MTIQTRTGERKFTWQELDGTVNPDLVRGVIAEGIRNWGYGLLLLGFIQIIANNFLDPAWGVVLILVGAASFYFRTAAMFPVYGVILAWAMVNNI